MWIGIIKLHCAKCSVPSHSYYYWNYYWNYCLPTTVFQVFRKNQIIRSLFLWSLSQATARSPRNVSKAYGYAAVCSWNTHIGETSGSPPAQVLLILKSNRSFVPFPLACTHYLRSEKRICWPRWEVDQAPKEARLGFFLSFFPPPLRSVTCKCSCTLLVLSWTSFLCVSLTTETRQILEEYVPIFSVYTCIWGGREKCISRARGRHCDR